MAYTLTDKKYDAVLAWINRVRAKYEIGGPLKRIPRGVAKKMDQCPIARALTGGPVEMAFVDPYHVALYTESGERWLAGFSVPKYVTAFIAAFDEGACSRLRKLSRPA